MPFARETLSELVGGSLANLAASLPGANPYQRRTVLNALGVGIAGYQNEQYGYLDYQAKSGVPFTSDGESLIGWAGLRGVTLEPAAKASGNVVFNGTPGETVFGAAQLQRGDGTLYTLPDGADLSSPGGTVSLVVVAQIAGAAGNCPPGTPLTLTAPQNGVSLNAVVDSGGIVGGADAETLDHLRTRNNRAWASPPQGGALGDYVTWALKVPGVTRAWAYSGGGGGAVVTYFMMDRVRAAQNGLPQGENGKSQYETRGAAIASGDQLVVANALFTVRPAGALLYGCAPVGVPLDLVLAEVPDDATIQSAITAALAGVCQRTAAPGGVLVTRRSSSGILTVQPGGVVRVSDLDDAIAAVPGLDHFVLVSPAADTVVNLGEISVPGSVTYQP